MARKFVWCLPLAILALAPLSVAQTASPTAPAKPAPAAPSPAATPAPSASGRSATGYGYGTSKGPDISTKYTPRSRVRVPLGPRAMLPGFTQAADGSSRFFLHLSQPLPIEERRGVATTTYVVKGAAVHIWNNTNPLLTYYFNTPVARARLVRSGRDAHFVLDFRAIATPKWRVDFIRGEATLVIDFAKGNYLPADGTKP